MYFIKYVNIKYVFCYKRLEVEFLIKLEHSQRILEGQDSTRNKIILGVNLY